MTVVVHLGVVWAYHIARGWFRCIKPFPEAVKKIKVKGKDGKTKDEFVPDVDHPSVLKYIKEKTNA